MTDFLIVGPQMSLCYINILPLVVEKKMWFGYNKVFEYEGGQKTVGFWFSSISDYEPDPLIFRKGYEESDFQSFDGQDVLNINSVRDIPDGYYGLMGVPLNCLRVLNREQFDILGIAHSGCGRYDFFRPMQDGKDLFLRWIIRRRKDYGKEQQ